MDNGIQSTERVKEFGEVFTPDSIVNDMLDLVDKGLNCTSDEEYILKTYLEPSCGDGQFLVRIVDRKIKAVNRLPKENRETNLLKAITSIYGVDIQADNVIRSRERMLELILNGTVKTFDLPNREIADFEKLDLEVSDSLVLALKKIMETNIQCGNTLKNERYAIKCNNGKYIADMNDKDDLTLMNYTFDENMVTATEYFLSDLGLASATYDPIDWHNLSDMTKEETDDYDF